MRLLAWITGIVVILALGGYALFHYLAPRAIASALSHLIHVPTSLEGVTASRGSWRLFQLSIDSPEGSRMPRALRVESLALAYPMDQAHPLGAELQLLDAAKVDLYLDMPVGPSLTGTNWGRLIEHLRSGATEAPSGTVSIDRMALQQVRVHLRGPLGLEHSLPMVERIEVGRRSQDLSNADVAQVTAFVLSEVLRSVLLEPQILEGISEGLHQTMESPKSVEEIAALLKESIDSLSKGGVKQVN